jgi:RNA polymerase sigma-70 factor (ECF subfamily)
MKTLIPDETLVQEFREDRDPDRLTALVSRYERPIYAFQLRLLKDSHQAEEAAQETFLRMLRGLPGFRPEHPFRPWLYRIALNAARTLAVRRAQQGQRERIASLRRREGEGTRNPSDGAFLKELHALVDELPPAQKEALLLHYYQGLSHSEVASALEVPPGTVATRIHRGLETLRGRLAPLGVTLSTLALAEYLGENVAEATPPSILSAVRA